MQWEMDGLGTVGLLSREKEASKKMSEWAAGCRAYKNNNSSSSSRVKGWQQA
jgi:hypothetical protein